MYGLRSVQGTHRFRQFTSSNSSRTKIPYSTVGNGSSVKFLISCFTAIRLASQVASNLHISELACFYILAIAGVIVFFTYIALRSLQGQINQSINNLCNDKQIHNKCYLRVSVLETNVVCLASFSSNVNLNVSSLDRIRDHSS